MLGAETAATPALDRSHALSAQEKALIAIVDAKAAAKQDSEASKKSKADEAVKNTAMGLEAVNQSLQLCGPGAKATPFGVALAMGDAGIAASPSQSLDSSGSGRVSPASSTVGTAGGRSSPTLIMGGTSDAPLPVDDVPASVTSRQVPALGDLVKDMGAPTIAFLVERTGCTSEEANHFLNSGFTFDLLSAPKAVALMAVSIGERMLNQRDRQPLNQVVAAIHDDDDGVGDVPGFDGAGDCVLGGLLDLYGVSSEEFHSLTDAKLFQMGWPVENNPTEEKIRKVAEQLAELLVLGGANTTIPQTAGAGAVGGGDAGASSSTGLSGKPKVENVHRARKSRTKKHKLAEDGIER